LTSPGSTTWREASNVASMRSGVSPRLTCSAIRVPSTTSPRSLPSAKIANGSLIQVRTPALPFQPIPQLGIGSGACQLEWISILDALDETVDVIARGPKRRRGDPKPSDARRLLHCFPSLAMTAYIGGSTPFVPTTTKPAASAPSSPRWAGTKTVAPGLRSASVAGPKVTIGTPSGMEIFFSLPLL
jgi:hypothetical protein